MTPVSRAATGKAYAGNASSLRFAEITCIIRHQAQFVDCLVSGEMTNYSFIGAWPVFWLYEVPGRAAEPAIFFSGAQCTL